MAVPKSTTTARKREQGRIRSARWAAKKRAERLALKPVIEPGSKRCPRCREVKPRDQFSLHRGQRDGLSSYCTPCNRQYLRQWHLANHPPLGIVRVADPEKARASQRRWAAEHKDKRAASSKRWYANNAESRRERRRRTYAADLVASREKARRDNKRWRTANPNAARAIEKRSALRNPARIRANARRRALTRRARERQAFVEVVDPLVVYKRDRGMCGICQLAIAGDQKWHIDHVVPLATGGAHSYANAQLAHARCNQSKGARVA
jgi:5-methylcytosine-specific restriction endonuclease McrA